MPGLCSNLNGEQKGTEALEEHVARAVRMDYAALKCSLNSESGQCVTGGAEGRREMFPESPATVPAPVTLPTPLDQQLWPLNGFSCLWALPNLSQTPAARVIASLIHSNISYWTLNCARYCCRHRGYSRNHMGYGRICPQEAYILMIFLTCSPHLTPLRSKVFNSSLWPTE